MSPVLCQRLRPPLCAAASLTSGISGLGRKRYAPLWVVRYNSN